MNRLWIRLSLMISAVLFSMFFLQFLAITLDGPDHDSGPTDEQPADIQGRLVEFMLFSLVVGTAGGFGIGRVVSSPVNNLVKAVQRVGDGELTVRVPVRGSLEFQELAQSFNKMAEDLQRTETLRNHLMADVSHELRTPLTVLESNLRAVLDHVYTLDEVEIATLYGQTRHLSRLVNDLRELALAEAHQLPLEKVPTNVTEIIAETLQALEPLALEKGIALRNKTSQLPEATLDPLRIQQVLFNLLTNALRHTPPGGTIILTGGSSADGMSISVQDNGEGLEAEQLTAVFNRFYRADKSRSRDTGGSGLGLAIVKALVEQHGGRVEVKSAGRGQGCEFILWLPLG
ncbi:MAG: HAMP domain-containing protein [Chloroflexi bacterium]|nr:HAMP domain-containing protein [Chloroflexota bacterium]